MAQKKTKTKLEALEKEMEEVRTELQKLQGLEKAMEHLAQNVAKLLQSQEETQKAVAALANLKVGANKSFEGGSSGSVTEGLVPASTFRADQRAPDRGKWSEGLSEASVDSDMGKFGPNREENNWRMIRKLEMPIFSGENPDGWLFQGKRYFEVNGLSEKEKLGIVGVSLDGETLSWLQWTEARTPFHRWAQFRSQLLLCFWLTQEGSLCEKLLAVKQEGLVAEYR